MKTASFALVLALAAAPSLFAQQAEPANSARLPVTPAAAPAPAPVAPVETEVTLIPEQVPQNPKPAGKPLGQSKTEQSSEEMLERIHLREARIKALRDPAVQAEWEKAVKAKTDYDKRGALKQYYTLLYAKILKIDSSVKKLADQRQQSSIHRLEQTRIDPTEPLDPEERAELFERTQQ